MPHPYNSRYYPPMPAIEVALGAPGADFSLGPLPTIVDTGADITTVPREYLVRLGAPVVASGYLRSLWGERHRVKTGPHVYEGPGTYRVLVKVIDIFGNDTSQVFKVTVTP